MNRKYNKKLILLFTSLAILVLSASCGSNGCEEVRETFCVASCENTTGNTLSKITIWGIGQCEKDTALHEDEILLDGISKPTDLSLILNPNDSVSQFRMQITGIVNEEQTEVFDTLSVKYEPFPYFINIDCGCSVFFTIKEVDCTNHFVQNAIIHQEHITNEEKINIILEY